MIRGNEDGLETKLGNLFEQKCKSFPLAFHRREMNAVCCRWFLMSIDMVIKYINNKVLKTFDRIGYR